MPPTDGRPDHAIVVNPDAARANPTTVQRISEIVDPDDVFVVDDLSATSAIVDDVLGRGYRTVFTAGGDGTVNHFVNHCLDQVPDDRELPRIGVLPLGSRNGLAELGGSRDALADLQTFVGNPSADSWHLPLCESESTRFAFCGLGLDAAVLADYRALSKAFGHGLGAYVTAVVGMTLPKRVFRAKAQVRITNVGGDAWSVTQTERGAELVERFPHGAVLYEGPVNATLMGTCPFYGHRFKLLPFAGVDAQRMHLRVSNVAPTRLIWGLRGLHKGTFAHKALHDFLVQRVHLAFSTPMPYQLAGELMGERTELEVGVTERAIDLVRFS